MLHLGSCPAWYSGAIISIIVIIIITQWVPWLLNQKCHSRPKSHSSWWKKIHYDPNQFYRTKSCVSQISKKNIAFISTQSATLPEVVRGMLSKITKYYHLANFVPCFITDCLSFCAIVPRLPWNRLNCVRHRIMLPSENRRCIVQKSTQPNRKKIGK